jgi:hypothetical protein
VRAQSRRRDAARGPQGLKSVRENFQASRDALSVLLLPGAESAGAILRRPSGAQILPARPTARIDNAVLTHTLKPAFLRAWPARLKPRPFKADWRGNIKDSARMSSSAAADFQNCAYYIRCRGRQ